MKILNLQFRNINSLQGDWEIRFNDMALGEAGLFAITGPVGAGKTSILDALTLALFGKTSRIGEDEITEVMTKNVDECYAQVEFAINGSVYRSRWGLKRTSEAEGGNILPPFMELAEIKEGESLLGNSRQAVLQHIAELTGLDFQRFSRTVLLAQHEFAAFLNAKESERFEIFEKITGTEIYAQIAETAASRFQQEEAKISVLKHRLGEISLIQPEDLSAIKAEINERRLACRELDSRQESLSETLKSFDNRQQLEKQREQCLAQVKAEQEKYQTVKAETARLETAKQAYLLKNEAERMEIRQRAAQEAVHVFEALQAELEAAEKELKEQETLFNNVQAELNSAFNNRSAVEKQAEQALILDRQIKTDEKHLTIKQEKLNGLRQDFDNLMHSRSNIEQTLKENRETQAQVLSKLKKCIKDKTLIEDIPKLRELLLRYSEVRSKRELAAKLKTKFRNAISSAEHELKKNRADKQEISLKIQKLAEQKDGLEMSLFALAGNMSPEEYGRKYETLVISEGQYKDLIRMAKAYAEYKDEREKLRKKHDHVGKHLAQLLKQRVDFIHDFNLERVRSAEVKKMVVWQNTIQSFEKIRRELKSGLCCPVCGAEEHPYVKHGPPKLGEPGKELELRRRNIGITQQQINRVERKKAKIQSRYGSHRRRLAEIDEKMAELSADWEQTCRQTGERLSISNIEILRAKMKTVQMEIKRKKGAVTKMHRLRKDLDQVKVKWENMKDRPQMMDEEISRLNGLLHSKTKELTIIEKELSAATDTEQSLYSDIQRLLAPYSEKPPEKLDDRNLLNNLEDRLKTLQYYEERSENLVTRQAELEEKLALYDEKSQVIEQEIIALDDEMRRARTLIENAKQRRREKFGDFSPLAEIKTLRKIEETCREKHHFCLLEYNRIQKKTGTKRDLSKIRRIEAEKLSAEAAYLEQTFAEKMKAAGFETIETLKQVTITQAEIRQIDENVAEAGKRLKRAENRLAMISRNLETLGEKSVPLSSKEEMLNDLSAIKLQKEQHETEILARKQQLHQQASLAEEKTRIQAEIEQRDKEKVRWSLLNTLSRAPEGYEFRKAAQSFTMDNLLGLTNRYLTRINGRYALVKRPNQWLGLEIADVYQQGVRRPPATLSGGERFLVSFSLAVGLSEMTAEHSQVKSLFLDENFGVLDEESLQVVVNSLMKLRSGGRQIGIITHLDYLRNRIHPHIRLEKRLDEPGTSRIILP